MQKQYSALKVENFANTMKTRTEMMARDAKWCKNTKIDEHKSWNSLVKKFNSHVVGFLFGPGIEQLHVVFSWRNQKEGLGPSQDCIKDRCWTEVRVPSCLTTIVGDQQVVWSRYWERFCWLTDQLVHKVVHWRLFYHRWHAVDGLKRQKNQYKLKLFQNNVHYVE